MSIYIIYIIKAHWPWRQTKLPEKGRQKRRESRLENNWKRQGEGEKTAHPRRDQTRNLEVNYQERSGTKTLPLTHSLAWVKQATAQEMHKKQTLTTMPRI